MAITLDMIKQHLRLDAADTSRDAELQRMHDAALEYAANVLSRPIPWTEEITNEAGDTVSVEVYPLSVQQAILILIAELFENREQHVIGAGIAENPTAYRLLSMYRTGLGA